jgi:hypothetical protein
MKLKQKLFALLGIRQSEPSAKEADKQNSQFEPIKDTPFFIAKREDQIEWLVIGNKGIMPLPTKKRKREVLSFVNAINWDILLPITSSAAAFFTECNQKGGLKNE